MSDFFKPSGHHLVVILDFVEKEKVSSGGIILHSDKAEQRAQANATVLAIGPSAWAGFEDQEGGWQPWCEVGDKVMIAQHAGQAFHIDEDLTQNEQKIAERVRLILDKDVLGVLNPETTLKDWCANELSNNDEVAA